MNILNIFFELAHCAIYALCNAQLVALVIQINPSHIWIKSFGKRPFVCEQIWAIFKY